MTTSQNKQHNIVIIYHRCQNNRDLCGDWTNSHIKNKAKGQRRLWLAEARVVMANSGDTSDLPTPTLRAQRGRFEALHRETAVKTLLFSHLIAGECEPTPASLLSTEPSACFNEEHVLMKAFYKGFIVAESHVERVTFSSGVRTITFVMRSQRMANKLRQGLKKRKKLACAHTQ